MSIKKDVARLASAVAALTPEQRDGLMLALQNYSSLLQRLRPATDAIAVDILRTLPMDDAKKLGRALKDCGVGVVLAFAFACAKGDPEKAALTTMTKLREAVEALPAGSTVNLAPILAPWEG